MPTLVVSAAFTELSGVPASGLTLSDISLTLVSRRISDGALVTIWNGTQHPTEEVSGIGIYTRAYATADPDTYDYFAQAEYTGALVLDSDYVTGAFQNPEAAFIADTVLTRDWIDTVAAVASIPARSLLNAARFLRNLWIVTAGTLHVKQEDDSTDAWTAVLTTDATANPVIGSDPT